MTDILKSALTEHADAASFERVDLAAIRLRGDRTLRRRRAGLAGGGLLAAGVAAAAVTLVVASGPDGSQGVPVARDPGSVAVDGVSWVEGSTLHQSGGDTIDLGRRPAAYVRTSAGYVFADDSGVVYSVVGETVTAVGRTDPAAIRLVSDPATARVVWLDGDRTGLVAFDQATGADITLEGRLRGTDPSLTALDGDAAYVTVGEEARRIDVVTGETTVEAVDGSEVYDAAGERLALGSDDGIRLSGGAGRPLVVSESYRDIGTFSLDGAWFTSDADTPQVVDTRTGESVDFDVPDFFASGYDFLDASTLAMITEESDGAPVVLQICQVPAGTCEPVVELGSSAELSDNGFLLPIGLQMG